MRTQCQHCREMFKAPNDYEGRKIKCPKCGKIFEIVSISNTKEHHSKSSDNMVNSSNVVMHKKSDSSDTKGASRPCFSLKIIVISVLLVIVLCGISIATYQIYKKHELAQKQEEILKEKYFKERHLILKRMTWCVEHLDYMVASVCLKSSEFISSRIDHSPPIIFGSIEEDMIDRAESKIEEIKDFIETYSNLPKTLTMEHNEILGLFDLIEQYHKIATSTNESLYRYKRSSLKIHTKIKTGLNKQTSKLKQPNNSEQTSVELFQESLNGNLELQVLASIILAKIDGNENQIRFLDSLRNDFKFLNTTKRN